MLDVMTMEETKNEKNGSNIKPVNVWKLGIQVVVMLLLIGVLIYMCVTSVIRYSRWPIYTETKTVPQNEKTLLGNFIPHNQEEEYYLSFRPVKGFFELHCFVWI